jgi:hypothetical protein
MSKLPPVPPDNQSPKGTGDNKQTPTAENPASSPEQRNPQQQGRQGNTKQNTTNQGYQQDR